MATIKNRRGQTNLNEEKTDSLLHIRIAEISLRLLFIFFFYLAVIVVISKLGNSMYHFAYPIFGNSSVSTSQGQDVKVTIVDGESTKSIISDLKNKKLIKDMTSFSIRCKLSLNKKKKIQPGTYLLNTSQNYGEILDQLTNTEEMKE